MLTSVIEGGVCVGPYPELAGKRVLITGVGLEAGVDIARTFAEQGCRIVLHTTGAGAEIDAILEMLAQAASELEAYSELMADADAAVRFAQMAARTFGGLDVVINLVRLDLALFAKASTFDDVERAIGDRFQNACLITRIAANRMRLTWSEGLILNVLTCGPIESPSDVALASIARTMLATLTRSEAQQWADQAIRINAVAPAAKASAAPCLSSEPDLAALALYLASSRGRELSGLVFDISGARCIPSATGANAAAASGQSRPASAAS
jgi:NAD(P)-dependent dehydrogenase (short-subunit alcohol dehydrogenase family)